MNNVYGFYSPRQLFLHDIISLHFGAFQPYSLVIYLLTKTYCTSAIICNEMSIGAMYFAAYVMHYDTYPYKFINLRSQPRFCCILA